MQYRIGTVSVTNGSPIVTGSGTAWLSAGFEAGFLFKKLGVNAFYEITTIDSDTQITLSSNYAGVTETDILYTVTVDYTDNFELPEVSSGDLDWPYTITRSLRLIDSLLTSSVHSFKRACRVASTVALAGTYSSNAKTITANATSALVVDGVSLAVNDRVLYKNHGIASVNGIYEVLNAGSVSVPWVLVRADDFNSSSDIKAGAVVFVTEGTVNADSGWMLSTNNTITLDTTSLYFQPFAYAGNQNAPMTSCTDPAINTVGTTAIVDAYSGNIVTLTTIGNTQVIANPTDIRPGKEFVVVNKANSSNNLVVNGVGIEIGYAQKFIWTGATWVPVTSVDAGSITFTPYGGLSSINVQAAIQELDDEKAPKESPVFTTKITTPIVQLGVGGPILKNSSGTIQMRNAADNAYALLAISGLDIIGANTRIYFNTSYRALEGAQDGSVLFVGESYPKTCLYGNVGIGIADPGNKLEVAGAITVTGVNTGHSANKVVLSQEGENNGAYLQSYGKDGSTNGIFTLRSYRSDGSNPIIVLRSDVDGSVEFSGVHVRLAPTEIVGWRYSAGDSSMYNRISNDYVNGIHYYSGGWTSSTEVHSHSFYTNENGVGYTERFYLRNDGYAFFNGPLIANSYITTTGLSASGQGRFKGWYSASANSAGPAAEVGVSSGAATFLGYDRTANAYIDTYFQGGAGNLYIPATGSTSTFSGNLTVSGELRSPNHSSVAAYNVFLGGANGRGLSAGYSGGYYGGIGYNIQHTASSGVYTAPSADTVSYIRFSSGGFEFLGAAAGTAGRTLDLVKATISAHVTGNVTGNLTGDVTGSVTGASSLNVLKSGDTMTGTLNLHSGAYNGLVTFGSDTSWRSGIRQWDSGCAELRIYAKHASGKIFLATGSDQSVATPALPAAGLCIVGNKVGIGDFHASNPPEALSVKSGTFLKESVNGFDGTYDTLIKYGAVQDMESGDGRVNRWLGIDCTVTAGAAADNKMKFRIYPGTAGNAEPVTVLTLDGGLNATFAGVAVASSFAGVLRDADCLRITTPSGASFVTRDSSKTGAIAITLPIWYSAMCTFTVKVYNYSTGTSFCARIFGYMEGALWYNPSVQIVGTQSRDNRYIVRFGKTAGGLPVVYIGELNASWSYPQIFITDFCQGFYQHSSYLTGWTVGFQASAFENVTQTVTDTCVSYAVSTNTASSLVLRDASGNFSAGTITATLSGNVAGNAYTATNLTQVGAKAIFLNRENSPATGISWYGTYSAWADYMAAASDSSCGPNASITAPAGTLVTTWALRRFIENNSGYGWTWESGTMNGQPTVVAEIRASDGSARFAGNVYAADFYADNWFRVSGAKMGLYHSGYGTHFYSSGAGIWNISSTSGTGSHICFRLGHESTIRGYVYNDGDGFGLLNNSGAWLLRSDGYDTTNVRVHGYLLCNNSIIVDNGSYMYYARYTTGSNSYMGTFNWYSLQLGNNGDNYIIAGRSATGGRFRFVVNNTSNFPNDAINGTIALTIGSDATATFAGTVTAPSFSGRASSATATKHYASRTDSQWYNVVWAAGDPSELFSCDGVQIYSNGSYLKASYFSSSDDAVNGGSLSYLMGKCGDNYLRSIPKASVATWLSGQTMNIAGSATTVSDAAISQAKLKTSSGEVYTNTNANLTLPGGEYGFYPQTYRVGGAGYHTYIAQSATNTSYVTNIYLTGGGGTEAYARQRYVTSSGEVYWVFLLRNKQTKEIISAYQAPDHPCFGNGGKPLLVPHPFGDYDSEIYEVVVINPTLEEVEIMKKQGLEGEDKADRGLLEVILNDYDVDEEKDVSWPSIPITVGLPKDHDWQMAKDDALVEPIKMIIPKPEGVILSGLKSKKTKIV